MTYEEKLEQYLNERKKQGDELPYEIRNELMNFAKYLDFMEKKQ